MSAVPCQLAAITSCYFMRRYNFVPDGLLNVGIGKTSPEVYIWQWLLPAVPLLGIDPRWSPRGNWTKRLRLPQVTAAVGDGSVTEAGYCGPCRSLKCTNPAHLAKTTVPVRTIDDIAAGLPGVLFIWMDIDGSEPEALRGATQTLKRTGWINVECHEKIYGPEHAGEIERLLAAAGFRLEFRHPRCEDRLYRNHRARAT